MAEQRRSMRRGGGRGGAAQSVSDLLAEIAADLEGAGIELATVEARDIVASVVGVGRFWPVLNRSNPVSDEVQNCARAAAGRRMHGAPFAYAVGQAAFRHLTLHVDERVLIPRQETEHLVGLVLARLRNSNGGVIADVGTGSGAIALSLATEIGTYSSVIPADQGHPGDQRHPGDQGHPGDQRHPGDQGHPGDQRHPGESRGGIQGAGKWIPAFAGMTRTRRVEKIIATDISRGAIDVAEINARSVLDEKSCPVEFRCGDMFSVIRETGLRAIVSNPPYIAFEEAQSLPSSVRNWEPPEALYSSRQGMRAVERLVKGSAKALESGGLLALEVDSNRASIAAELVLTNGAFRDVCVELDLSGRERFVLATKM